MLFIVIVLCMYVVLGISLFCYLIHSDIEFRNSLLGSAFYDRGYIAGGFILFVLFFVFVMLWPSVLLENLK